MNIFSLQSRDIDPIKTTQSILLNDTKDDYIVYYTNNQIEIVVQKTKLELKKIIEETPLEVASIFKAQHIIKLKKIKL